MSDTERRKKMISLRLSDVEYDILKARYRTCGARNISDLARLALQRMMNGSAGSQDGFAAKLAELDDRVHALEAHLARMPLSGPKWTDSAAESPRVLVAKGEPL